MAGSSHYNAICTVRIITVDGSEVDEYLMGVGTDYPFITSVEVQRVFERSGQITINIEAPFFEGRELLNGPLFFTGNKVIITMSYPDNDDAFFQASGVILKGGIGLSITPNGLSGTVTVQGQTITSSHVKPVVLAGDSSKQTYSWLETVVLKCGYQSLVASERIIEDINDIEVQTNETKELITYVEDFCAMNGFIFLEKHDYTTGLNDIVITDEEEIDGSDVSRVFVMRDSFIDTGYLNEYDFIRNAGAQNVTAYPIITFSPEMSSGFFANSEAVKIKQIGIISDGKIEDLAEDESSVKTVKKGLNSKDQNVGGEDAKAGTEITVEALDESSSATVLSPLYPETKSRKADEKRLTRLTARKMISYNASLTTFGIPELVPGEKVAVVGLGQLLDGIFTVKEVTQVWNAGKIDTTLGIYGRSNGVS